MFSSVEDYIKSNKWHFLATPLNFITVLWILLGNFILDLSNFFNKAVLNIPSNHTIIIIRIVVILFVAFVA